jgi:hypothetical protein
MMLTAFFPAWLHQLAPMSRSRCLVQHLRHATLAQIETRLSPALPHQLLDPPKHGDNSRHRIYPLFRTFWCWIWQILQANTSCREVVRQVQALFALNSGVSVDEGSGAFCQARQKLPLAVLEKAFAASAQSAQGKAPHADSLQSRRLRVMDASNVRLPDTSENRKAYPPSMSAPSGSGFPLLKVVVLFCLASGAIVARAVGTQLVHEIRICEALRAWLAKGDIVVADRAYGSYAILVWLQSLGVDLIARVPTRSRKVDFRKAKKRYAPGDALFSWDRSRKACAFLPLAQWLGLPVQCTVRVLRTSAYQSGFRTRHITLVTTLLDPVLYPAQEIIAAYARRWRLEMCLDDIKTTLSMESLSCRSPKMVEKELLVFLTAHNLLRWLMATVAQERNVDLERISFKGSLDGFRQWSQALAQLSRSRHKKAQREHLWVRFIEILAADLVPFRPGRREHRAIKKPKKYPHLNRPRPLFREPLKSNERKSRRRARRALNAI